MDVDLNTDVDRASVSNLTEILICLVVHSWYIHASIDFICICTKKCSVCRRQQGSDFVGLSNERSKMAKRQ